MTEQSPLVLVVEDDRPIRESLERILGFEGYEVCSVTDGAAALDSVSARPPDLIVLDIMLPVIDGLTVCRRLRAHGCPSAILMLTARSDVRDRVAGLDAGADDYLPKPFSLDEFLARVRALLRRFEPATAVLRVGDLSLDAGRRRVERGGVEIQLTRTEFSILELLMRHEDHVLDRSRLYEEIWGYDFTESSKSLDVHVGYLRQKLERHGGTRVVHTVRGVGYVIRGETAT